MASALLAGGFLLGLAGGCGSQPVARPVVAKPVTVPAQVHEFAEAKDLFYRSVAGDHDALPAAQKKLEDLGGGSSSDPQVVAYTGAAKLLQAARAPFWEKPQLGREGLDLEDRAVAMAPKDLEVRFLRGVTAYQLPEFLGRRATATSDLAYVASVAEQAARDGRLDPRAAAADLVYDGKVREEKYDAAGAIADWRAAVRISPDSPGGKDALKHLAEHNVSP